ncbi:MAG: sigma-70 family RNA polymerase sigma factor [Steroidobacteraceae bacterium]
MVASHSSHSQQVLSDQYRAALMSYFLKRVGNRAEAEDLTQEVFYRLLRTPVGEQQRTDAYVFTIAANLLRDRARHDQRSHVREHQTVDEQADILDEGLIDQRAPERVLAGQQLLDELLSALGTLPERTRDIFVLFRLEGLSQREIAELHGISVSAVEKHVVKALTQLTRARLDQDQPS